MASVSDFTQIALGLAGTTSAPHFDRTAFKVRRTYATLAADGRSANLKLTPDEQEFKVMLAPEAFAAVGREELAAALEMAWTHAVKK